MGVVFYGDYCALKVGTTYNQLDLTIEGFMPMLDKIEKINSMIDKSEKLIKGELKYNCIGENETLITFENGFFRLYAITASVDSNVEIESSDWICLLEKIKEFMLSENQTNRIVSF